MAITNLTNTTWTFKSTPTYATSGTFNINFTSNGENFTSLIASNWGACVIGYGSVASAYQNSWKNENYKVITITGGADVENADLIAFLQANASLPLEFTETKTALKIYEDLSKDEYDGLTKEPNAFYQVNEVGVYKGEKLIAKNDYLPKGISYVFEGDNLHFEEMTHGGPSYHINMPEIFNNVAKRCVFFATITFDDYRTIDTPILTNLYNSELVLSGGSVLYVNASKEKLYLFGSESSPLVEGSITKIVVHVATIFDY